MKAIEFTRPEVITMIDLPDPPAPGPGEALVRTHRMGICGTDLSGYLGKMPFLFVTWKKNGLFGTHRPNRPTTAATLIISIQFGLLAQ